MNKFVAVLIAQCACVGLVMSYGSVTNTQTTFGQAYPGTAFSDHYGSYGTGYGFFGLPAIGVGSGQGVPLGGSNGIFGSLIYLFLFVFLVKILFPSNGNGGVLGSISG
ncbi:hypothetical protein DPMN_074576 [Dreissena polymorpha]|uniref:Uncharacterized protein n=1 Tax=Dreissena polymorpha TaxID=45954 RepID=A0A9D4BKT0_DREPO|nr:hypothetical protein DPMN_074576 [Dreissena polymorpha]